MVADLFFKAFPDRLGVVGGLATVVIVLPLLFIVYTGTLLEGVSFDSILEALAVVDMSGFATDSSKLS